MFTDGHYEYPSGLTFPERSECWPITILRNTKSPWQNSNTRWPSFVQAHKYGQHNRLGQLRNEITVEDVLNSAM